MPYYLYKVFPFHRLEKVAVLDAFPQASAQAKALRKDPALPADCKVKVVFAEHELGAEALLTEVREPQPRLEDD
ncbi:MAG: hypothetical protein K8F93_04225 [Burkholderiales bacterium]|jgi:hypothetical protein|nr:hypothetical protein [Burkholderiales bacterium]MBZ0248843.1 hypothetical protein [Burkholderiales bacterium]MCL4689718.1 hypothetical protein [Burkholderiales bacterium]